MKLLPLFVFMLLTGCRTATPLAPNLPAPQVLADVHPIVVTPAMALPSTPPPAVAHEQKLTHQAQLIEALMSQNDALTARLNAPSTPPPEPPKPEAARPAAESDPHRAITPPATAAAIAAPIELATFLTTNADGLVDLTALDAAGADAANPFAVRRLASDPAREITLQVAGIITGRTPAALINERLMQAGDVVETLTVERIETDAVVLRHQTHLLRLPITGKPARVRLSL
jgi:hypothetical protein